MQRNRKILIASGAILALAAGGVGIAQAIGGDSDERVTGPEADRAAAAAVKAVGGGDVTGVEREDEGDRGWEVEVKRPDGSQVEVHLTDSLDARGTNADDDGAGDHDGEGEE